MNKKMKYTSKNGYTGVMYGNSSLVIIDENGKMANYCPECGAYMKGENN